MFEIDNKQDHFVPRMYLKRFSLPDEPDMVYVFDKQNPATGVVERSIRKVERSRDAYTTEVDRVLTELEGTWQLGEFCERRAENHIRRVSENPEGYLSDVAGGALERIQRGC